MKASIPSIQLRPEQQEAVRSAFSYWQSSKTPRQFLWNAKPRFGKTISAYHLALQISAERILVITNRPIVYDAWARDFFQYIQPHTEYIFASSKGGNLSFGGKSHRIYSRTELIKDSQLLQNPLIFFISLQDAKGKAVDSDDFKSKNQWLFQLDKKWDLLIIDEGHEGVKTAKTSNLINRLNVDFTLYLSGTPFRALADQDFQSEQIYNWTYIDEQKNQSSLPSPKIKFYTSTIKDFLDRSRPSENYEIGDFFRVSGSRFAHQDIVLKWLNKLEGVFSNAPVDNGYLQHTFWLLSGVKECIAMQKILQSHPFFSDFNIILAAGRAESYKYENTLARIRSAIGTRPLRTKTITLSCGQLTTGITIPEWTAVFMLYSSTDLNRLSVAQYLQAIFRAQGPWLSQTFQKEECIVFDFAPDRALKVILEYALNLCNTNHEVDDTQAVKNLLRYLSVYSLSRQKVKQLSAREVIEVPRKVIAQEIVDGAFISSNKLFNFTNLSHMSESAREIISKFSAAPKQRFEKDPRHLEDPKEIFTEQDESASHLKFIQQSFAEVLQRSKYANLNKTHQQAIQTLAGLTECSQNPDVLNPQDNYLLHEAWRETKELAAAKARQKQDEFENECRNKLRSFVRTIPILLHLYGEQGTKLESLITIVPDNSFKLLTGITKSEFKVLLREGYFNESNCNLAMQEFMEREIKFSNYFKDKKLNSIFDYIPAQNSDQIFTPAPFVASMVTKLQEARPDIFHSVTTKFLDPSSKSGLFLAEIVRRLFLNTRSCYGTDQDCLCHILTEQIYSWSPHEIFQRSTINTVLSFSRFLKINFSEIQQNEILKNFQIVDTIKTNTNNHQINKQQGDQGMKFDVIIGNPPYRSGRRQVYAEFYKLAVDLDPELVCMVFPIGWQKPHNHNGLGQINNEIYKRDPHIVSLDHYYENGKNRVFPEIGTGGVNIILRDRKHDNHGKICKLEYGKVVGSMTLSVRPSEVSKPTELSTLIGLFNDLPKIESLGSSRKPYGFYADPLRNPEKYRLRLHDTPRGQEPIRLFGLLPNGTRGYKYITRAELPKESENLQHHKLFVPKAWGNMSGAIGLGGSYANICVASPNDACSETFIEFGPFSTREETIKMAKYFMTRFFRALLFLAKDSQNTARDKYKFIPVPDLNLPMWDNSVAELEQKLMDYYHIPLVSQEFILQNVQPRSEKNIEML